MFLQYEKELNESNGIIKGCEKCIDDDKSKNDAINKVFEKKT